MKFISRRFVKFMSRRFRWFRRFLFSTCPAYDLIIFHMPCAWFDYFSRRFTDAADFYFPHALRMIWLFPTCSAYNLIISHADVADAADFYFQHALRMIWLFPTCPAHDLIISNMPCVWSDYFSRRCRRFLFPTCLAHDLIISNMLYVWSDYFQHALRMIWLFPTRPERAEASSPGQRPGY